MTEYVVVRKEWWDEAREKFGVSAVDFDYVPVGDKVIVKAKVAAKDIVVAYGVLADMTTRWIGAAQVKAMHKAIQYIKGEFEKMSDDEEDGEVQERPRRQSTARRTSGSGRGQRQRDNKYPPNADGGKYVCEVCGAEISPGVARYSKDKFGVYLCREHQQEAQEQ